MNASEAGTIEFKNTIAPVLRTIEENPLRFILRSRKCLLARTCSFEVHPFLKGWQGGKEIGCIGPTLLLDDEAFIIPSKVHTIRGETALWRPPYGGDPQTRRLQT
uniref:Uncharacterized protein n=1 Tax=Coccidioides posadasii RMSCC 3488 TaxID=454284 RepID=A0A0J6I8K1_COCPO|nr:hypothetical protein CPAG_04170 [Coccidioides posadasii RMSCC 3488]